MKCEHERRGTRFAFFFGGTFDPPHFGHHAIVRYLTATYPQSTVVVMPAFAAPLREDIRLFSFRERFRLLRALFAPEILAGRVRLSWLEARLPRPNYTWQTLVALAKYCNSQPVIVIGADQAAKIFSWYKGGDLMRMYTFVVFAREGDTATLPVRENFHYIKDFSAVISATAERDRLRALSSEKRFTDAARALRSLAEK